MRFLAWYMFWRKARMSATQNYLEVSARNGRGKAEKAATDLRKVVPATSRNDRGTHHIVALNDCLPGDEVESIATAVVDWNKQSAPSSEIILCTWDREERAPTARVKSEGLRTKS
jgi:hypothetical protein